MARAGRIGVDVRGVGQQRVRRTPYRPALGAEIDVAVAADRGVARPFVARQGDEAAVLVEFGGQLVDMRPERVVDLEVVGLVAGRVEEGQIAREREVLARGADADRFARLAVHIRPIAGGRRVADDQRVGIAQNGAAGAQDAQPQRARLGDAEALDGQRALAQRIDDFGRQTVDRHIGLEGQRLVGLVGRVAPGVLGLDAEHEALARAPERRQHGLPDRRVARHDGDRRAGDDGHEMADRADVGEHLEFEAALAEGLHLHARRAARGVAEGDRDGVALAQAAAAHPHRQAFEPGPRVALRMIIERQRRLVVGDRGDVVGRLRVVGLQPAPVGRETEHDADRAGVVDAIAPDDEAQRESLQAARLEGAGWLELGAAEQHRVLGRLGGRPDIANEFCLDPGHRERPFGWVVAPSIDRHGAAVRHNGSCAPFLPRIGDMLLARGTGSV